jgi:hypothetical protein
MPKAIRIPIPFDLWNRKRYEEVARWNRFNNGNGDVWAACKLSVRRTTDGLRTDARYHMVKYSHTGLEQVGTETYVALLVA